MRPHRYSINITLDGFNRAASGRLAVLHITRLLILSWIGSLQACASPGRTAAADGPLELPERYLVSFRVDIPPHRTVLNASIDRVEELVPSVYQHLGIPVGSATNTREVVFITPNMGITGRLYEGERNSEYIDCGTGLTGVLADQYKIQFAMLTRLREGEDGTTIVETFLGGQARARDVSNTPVDCTGTGKLEQMIADLLRLRVGGRGQAHAPAQAQGFQG